MTVTRLDMTTRESLLGGKRFGATGAYEVLRGTVTLAVDPAHPRNHNTWDTGTYTSALRTSQCQNRYSLTVEQLVEYLCIFDRRN